MRIGKKVLSLFLVIALILGATPITFAANGNYIDVPPTHWASGVIAKWSGDGYGVLQGDGNSNFLPGKGITLGELATILSKSFGYTERTVAEVTPSWAKEYVEKAIAAGVMDKADKIDASVTVNREQAIKYIALAYNVAPIEGETTFADNELIGAEYKSYIRAFHKLGYVVGDNKDSAISKFNPKANYTRAEAMQVIDNTTSDIIDKSISEQNYAKSLIIRKSGVAVKNTNVKGNLIIGQGVGDGEVTLENVTINGSLVVYGGGSASINITGEKAVPSAVVNKPFGEPVHLNGEFGTVTVTSGTKVIITGKVEKLIILGDAEITLNDVAIDVLEIVGANVKISVGKNGTVENVIVGTNNVVISGDGVVRNVNVTEEAKYSVEVLTVPTKVAVDPKAGSVKTKSGDIEAGTTATTSNSSRSQYGGSGGYNPPVLPPVDPPTPPPVLTPDSPFLNPNDSNGGEITRLQWISDLVEAAKLSMYNVGLKSSYSDVDENNPYFEAHFPDYSGAIEIALQNNAISASESEGNRFYPERAATEAFAVVSAVRALGFIYDDLQDCYKIANDCGIFSGTPTTNNLTINQASSILSAIAEFAAPVLINPNAEQVVNLGDDTIILSDDDLAQNYAFDEETGMGNVHLEATAINRVNVGDCIILPANNEFLGGLAQKVVSVNSQVYGAAILETTLATIDEVMGDGEINIQGIAEVDMGRFIISDELADEFDVVYEYVYKSDLEMMSNIVPFSAFNKDVSLYAASSNKPKVKIVVDSKGKGYIELEYPDKDENAGLNAGLYGKFKIYLPEIEYKADIDWFAFAPVKVNELYLTLTETAKIEGGVKWEEKSKNKEERRLKLGNVPIPLGTAGFTAEVEIYVKWSVKGTLSLECELSKTSGVQYIKGHLRNIDKPPTIDIDFKGLEVEGKIGPEVAALIKWVGCPLVDLSGWVGVGLSASPIVRDIQNICVDGTVYLIAEIVAFKDSPLRALIGADVKWVLADKKNTPWKKFLHFEGPLDNISFVSKCTFEGDPSPGGTPGGGTPGDGSLPYDSNLSFENKFNSWTISGDCRIISSLGSLAPTHGKYMAILGTGFGAVNESDSKLSRTFTVPSGTKYLKLDYDFISEEPMEFIGSKYDDTLIFSIIVNGVEHEIKRLTLNTTEWGYLGGNYFPDGDDTTYHTKWTELAIDISSYKDPITLVVRIFDKGDSLYDSAALIDNLRFTK